MINVSGGGAHSHSILFRHSFDLLLFSIPTATVAIPMGNEKDIEEENALLGDEEINSPERYPTSQWRQFWTVLKRTLLFSRRDWVR